jgi:hypothetical protein
MAGCAWTLRSGRKAYYIASVKGCFVVVLEVTSVPLDAAASLGKLHFLV